MSSIHSQPANLAEVPISKISEATATVKEKYRKIYLLVYPAVRFKGHWVFFIPNAASPRTGVISHANGDVFTGFTFSIERNYVPEEDTRRPRAFQLGEILNEYVLDAGDEVWADDVPMNKFEEICQGVPTPVKSLRNASNESQGRPTRLEQRDCQSWIKDVLNVLIEDELIDAKAVVIAENAPQQ